MIELKCKSCGSPLVETANGKYKCEYCGTMYERDLNITYKHYVETAPAKAATLRSEMSVPLDMCLYMNEDDLTKYTISELTKQLSEGLAAFMRITTNRDAIREAMIIRGEVRVIHPDFRF